MMDVRQFICAIGLIGAAAVPGAVAARQIPVASAGDPRVRIVPYTPEDVVLVAATVGYAVTLDFGPEEQIETVSVGDGLNWQLTPNRGANLLFVKPMAANVSTNMTVVTNLHSHHFELRSRRRNGPHDPNLVFAIRFDHPAPAYVAEAPEASEPEAPLLHEANNAYSYDGSEVSLPIKVFDDGSATYFRFGEQTDIPAIFAIDRDGKETLVNIANRDGYVVADRIAPQFVLRQGKQVTRVYNDGYRAPEASETQLLPHKKRKKKA